jgi:hypothetical protein
MECEGSLSSQKRATNPHPKPDAKTKLTAYKFQSPPSLYGFSILTAQNKP